MMFRVFFAAGGTVDVEAATPDQARKIADPTGNRVITKVKRVKS